MHRIVSLPLCLGLIFLSAPIACATVTPIGQWRLGELDLNAIPNDPCQPFTIDAAGGFNLARQGTLAVNNAFYSSNVSPAAAATTGSGLAIRFDNAQPQDPCRYFHPTDPCIGCTDNFGVEMWVRSSGAQPDEGFGVVAYGQKNVDVDGSFTIGQAGNSWFAGIQSSVDTGYNLGSVPVTSDWIHLALVVDGGVSNFYADGALIGSVNATPLPADGGFGIGGFSSSHANFAARRGFYGLIDEARTFTFEPGQFSPDDLLVNQPAVPEPGSMMFVGLVSLAARRRRRV